MQKIMAIQLLLLVITSCCAQSPPVSIPMQTIPTRTDSVCPSQDQLAGVMQATKERIISTLIPGLIEGYPASSCTEIPANVSSGYYWILPATGPPAVQVYCDFNRQCGCDGPSTWTRVAFLKMSDPHENCPGDWVPYSSPVRACGAGYTFGQACRSVFYSNHAHTYNRVCGRILAYQNHNTVAFWDLITKSFTIDQSYVDGVSLTHGSMGSRQHIWSFASGRSEYAVIGQTAYACTERSDHTWPYFIGHDYFCDSGSLIIRTPAFQSFTPTTHFGMALDAVLAVTAASSTTLHGSVYKTLSQPTTDDLEVRLCSHTSDGDTPIELMEFYVQ